jgi:hypothetical protein
VELTEVAAEAFVFGYPHVLMDRALTIRPGNGPIHAIGVMWDAPPAPKVCRKPPEPRHPRLEEDTEMSTADPARAAAARSYSGGDAAARAEYAGAEPGDGWVLFAGTMLAILGTLNVIDGIAAVSNSKFFTQNATYIISNLNTWGWILICMGAAQVLLAIGIWARVRGLRWIGVGIAALNAVAQLVFMPAYPFWSLSLFALDILVIYGLVAHGARPRAAA